MILFLTWTQWSPEFMLVFMQILVLYKNKKIYLSFLCAYAVSPMCHHSWYLAMAKTLASMAS